MGQLLDKIKIMDKVYVCFELLDKELITYYQTNFSLESKNICLQYLTEIENYSRNLNLEITPLINRIHSLIAGNMDITLYDKIILFIQKAEDIFHNIYMMNISSESSYKEEIIINHFNTDYNKNALLVYILRPFIFPNIPISHTNQVEAGIIARTLSERGFNLDLINSQYIGEIDYEKYDLIIGEGITFENICKKINKKDTKTIYYLTRASSYFFNMASLKRLRYFELRNGFLPNFERFTMDLLDLPTLTKINTAICLGNEHTVSTYKDIFSNIYPLNVTGFSDFTLPTISKSNNPKNFLWYGGAGAIHKGLDLCIEAFRLLPDLNLHIVGNVSSEFFNFYKNDFEQSKNVFYYGFLLKDSEEFKYICEECSYHLNPSCSESQSTAVITTMFSGIVPVCTVENGIDIEKVGGFFINDITIDSLCQLIRRLSNINKEELLERQKKVYEYCTIYHSEENYYNNLNRIFDNIYNI